MEFDTEEHKNIVFNLIQQGPFKGEHVAIIAGLKQVITNAKIKKESKGK